MKGRLVFVPPGGGEADYQLSFELPSIPQTGDYISIRRPDSDGTEDFIVRRSLWELHHPNTAAYEAGGETASGSATNVWVECEFAISPYSTESHKAAAQRYGAKEFEDTAY